MISFEPIRPNRMPTGGAARAWRCWLLRELGIKPRRGRQRRPSSHLEMPFSTAGGARASRVWLMRELGIPLRPGRPLIDMAGVPHRVLRRRTTARAYYANTIDLRRKLAREGKQRRYWSRWLINELRAELELKTI